MARYKASHQATYQNAGFDILNGKLMLWVVSNVDGRRYFIPLSKAEYNKLLADADDYRRYEKEWK